MCIEYFIASFIVYKWTFSFFQHPTKGRQEYIGLTNNMKMLMNFIVLLIGCSLCRLTLQQISSEDAKMANKMIADWYDSVKYPSYNLSSDQLLFLSKPGRDSSVPPPTQFDNGGQSRSDNGGGYGVRGGPTDTGRGQSGNDSGSPASKDGQPGYLGQFAGAGPVGTSGQPVGTTGQPTVHREQPLNLGNGGGGGGSLPTGFNGPPLVIGFNGSSTGFTGSPPNGGVFRAFPRLVFDICAGKLSPSTYHLSHFCQCKLPEIPKGDLNRCAVELSVIPSLTFL